MKQKSICKETLCNFYHIEIRLEMDKNKDFKYSKVLCLNFLLHTPEKRNGIRLKNVYDFFTNW